MSVAGVRVGIVGGSIGGCAAAVALARAGCDVTVFERTRGVLRDRSYGVAIPLELRGALRSAGYLDGDLPATDVLDRVWLVRDGDEGFGRVLGHQHFQNAYHNWGILWRSLRARVADRDYRDGTPVRAVEPDSDGVVLVTDAGRHRFDLVVGADGHRSTVRPLVDPDATPTYAGYGLWRGSYPTDRLPGMLPLMERTLGRGAFPTILFSGGHGVVAPIPDFTAGRTRFNWGIYAALPDTVDATGPTSTGAARAAGPELTGELERLLTEHMPARWAELIRQTRPDELLLQPIYDMTAARLAAGRLLLIGDAAAVARPHTGAGATKALREALALGEAAGRFTDWDSILERYHAERHRAAADQVTLGRRLGQSQVIDTPDWASMTAAEFERWMDTQRTMYTRAP